MRRKMDFLRHATPKMGIKKETSPRVRLQNHFGRMNLSLIGCFPAEPISVSIQHFKIQSLKLYLQPVKFSSQLPFVFLQVFKILRILNPIAVFCNFKT